MRLVDVDVQATLELQRFYQSFRLSFAPQAGSLFDQVGRYIEDAKCGMPDLLPILNESVLSLPSVRSLFTLDEIYKGRTTGALTSKQGEWALTTATIELPKGKRTENYTVPLHRVVWNYHV